MSVSCRDRAKERREGLAIDYVDAEQELAARGLGPTALQSLTIGKSLGLLTVVMLLVDVCLRCVSSKNQGRRRRFTGDCSSDRI